MQWLACGEEEPPPSDEWLSERDRRRLGAMTFTKRHDEARLSRWTAQRAVAMTLGLGDSIEAVSRVEVTNAPDGSPRARVDGFDAVSISSTDRAGWAVSAVLTDPLAVGCDLELVEPRSEGFVRDWFTPAERRFVAAGSLDADVAANLVWSAKESALKVLRTGLRRDTRSVEVSLEPGTGDGWTPLVVAAGNRRFPGWWCRHGPFLLTIAADGPFAEPRSLVEPVPLASATPAHSWVDRPRRRPS